MKMSFRFFITQGSWSPDWTEYHIDGYDIHRGDVAIVGEPAYDVADVVGEKFGTRCGGCSALQIFCGGRQTLADAIDAITCQGTVPCHPLQNFPAKNTFGRTGGSARENEINRRRATRRNGSRD